MKLNFTRRSLRHLEELRAYIGQHDPHAGIASLPELVKRSKALRCIRNVVDQGG